jgi:hypothetical protein
MTLAPPHTNGTPAGPRPAWLAELAQIRRRARREFDLDRMVDAYVTRWRLSRAAGVRRHRLPDRRPRQAMHATSLERTTTMRDHL